MGRHIHYKDGKFNIWSTIIDAYELKEWVPQEGIVEAFVQLATEEAAFRANEACAAAIINNGCSIRFQQFRCVKI